jgi:CheY-like chemotaxis protein
MRAFPLISIPKRIVYVDDKGSFLEALRKTLPRDHARQFIDSPAGAIERLQEEVVYWRDLERMLNVMDSGSLDHPGVAKQLVGDYFNNYTRFHLTSVLIVDYMMPGINGLEVIEQLDTWPGRRILLTGEADSRVAVNAFNRGLIQKFIPKTTKNLYRVLKADYEEMHEVVCEQIGHLLRPSLSEEQKDVLQDPAVVEGLKAMVEDLEWSEYVVVGRPFGLLGLSHSGPLQWIQLETQNSLFGLTEMLQEQGVAARDVELVRSGAMLSNMDLHHQLDLKGRVDLQETKVLGSETHVYAAVFDLDVPVLTSKSYGIDDIMSPMEEVRSMIRDLLKSYQLRSTSQDSEWNLLGDDALSPTLAPNLVSTHRAHERDIHSMSALLLRLGQTASRSSLHRHALEQVLRERELPPDLAAHVEASVLIGRTLG